MRRKDGSFLGFTGIRLVSFVISAMSFLILVMIAMMIWSVFAPEPTADAAATSFFDDFKNKIDLLEKRKTGDSLISAGTIEKGIWIRSVSGQVRDCRGKGNVCICICKDESCSNVIKCEKFSLASESFELAGNKNIALRLKKNPNGIGVECLNSLDGSWKDAHLECLNCYIHKGKEFCRNINTNRNAVDCPDGLDILRCVQYVQ